MLDWSRAGARERLLHLVACLVAVAVGSAGYDKSGVDLTAVEAGDQAACVFCRDGSHGHVVMMTDGSDLLRGDVVAESDAEGGRRFPVSLGYADAAGADPTSGCWLGQSTWSSSPSTVTLPRRSGHTLVRAMLAASRPGILANTP
jgi:hypothetical protein